MNSQCIKSVIKQKEVYSLWQHMIRTTSSDYSSVHYVSISLRVRTYFIWVLNVITVKHNSPMITCTHCLIAREMQKIIKDYTSCHKLFFSVISYFLLLTHSGHFFCGHASLGLSPQIFVESLGFFFTSSYSYFPRGEPSHQSILLANNSKVHCFLFYITHLSNWLKENRRKTHTSDNRKKKEHLKDNNLLASCCKF